MEINIPAHKRALLTDYAEGNSRLERAKAIAIIITYGDINGNPISSADAELFYDHLRANLPAAIQSLPEYEEDCCEYCDNPYDECTCDDDDFCPDCDERVENCEC
jgi:hypothetical protein